MSGPASCSCRPRPEFGIVLAIHGSAPVCVDRRRERAGCSAGRRQPHVLLTHDAEASRSRRTRPESGELLIGGAQVRLYRVAVIEVAPGAAVSPRACIHVGLRFRRGVLGHGRLLGALDTTRIMNRRKDGRCQPFGRRVSDLKGCCSAAGPSGRRCRSLAGAVLVAAMNRRQAGCRPYGRSRRFESRSGVARDPGFAAVALHGHDDRAVRRVEAIRPEAHSPVQATGPSGAKLGSSVQVWPPSVE